MCLQELADLGLCSVAGFKCLSILGENGFKNFILPSRSLFKGFLVYTVKPV